MEHQNNAGYMFVLREAVCALEWLEEVFQNMHAHCCGFAGVNVSKKHALASWLMKGEMQDLFTVLVFARVYAAGLGLAKEQIPTLAHGGDYRGLILQRLRLVKPQGTSP